MTAQDRGQLANSPAEMPRTAWKEIVGRVWRQTWIDNVGLVSAGVAFYGFLAFVPLLGLIALVYGFVAPPDTAITNLRALTAILPKDVGALIGQLLLTAVATSKTTKGLSFVIALAFSLYGGSNGMGAIITALNIAYQEREKRSLGRFYLLTLLMTAGALIIAVGALVATAAVNYLGRLVPQASSVAILAGQVAAYVVLALVASALAATLYRVAPSREKARWRWITPGSLFTGLTWMLLTLLFSFYATRVTNYNVTYGPLGTIIALLTWMYLSAYVLVIGAELNTEIEYQTNRDSTTGAPKPMGTRGAWAADNAAPDAAPKVQVEVKGESPSLGAAGPPVPAAEELSRSGNQTVSHESTSSGGGTGTFVSRR